ncbi:hypothetical protein L208DRAFT_1415830 [Tricholoma matsutake]|nr:hypothetical protein L208DRAFT_1415830 [Tricholoma matsutake 945]
MVHISTLLIVTWFTASSIALPVDHNDLPERATYEILSDNSANAHGSHCDPTHPIPSCSNSQVPPPEVHRSHSDLTNRQSSPSIDGITEDALKMWTRHLLNSKYRDTIEQGFLYEANIFLCCGYQFHPSSEQTRNKSEIPRFINPTKTPL